MKTVGWVGFVLLASCASTQAEQVRDARTGAVNARTEAKTGRIDERAEARSERIDARYDAKQERVENSDRPGEDARETLVEVSAERAHYGSDARARLNKLSARINAAHEKLNVLGSRAPLTLKTELETTAQQYNLLKADIISLESTAPAEWEDTKQDIDHRASLLDERVSSLNEKIDDV